MRIEVYRSGLIPQHVFESVSELLQDAFGLIGNSPWEIC